MITDPISVTLLAPGCFSMIAQTSETGMQNAEAEASPVEVDLNDSKAITTATSVYEQALADALNQPIPEMGQLPSAFYQYQLDTGNQVPEHCVCAELVHLQAGTSNARLVPESALNIDQSEYEQLLESLNNLIREDGFEVHRSQSGRCYLTGMPASMLDTWPAHAVANGKIAYYLPRHKDAGDWRRLMTEVQMLFHSHPVNVMRAELRQLPINSMWFWGGNQSPNHQPVSDVVLFANDVYAEGLSASLNMKMQSEASSSWSAIETTYLGGASKNNIVIVDRSTYEAWLRDDHHELSNAKQRLQDKWIAPIQQAVAQGAVTEFILDGCEGQAIVERQAKPSTPASVASNLLSKVSLSRFSPKRLFRSK